MNSTTFEAEIDGQHYIIEATICDGVLSVEITACATQDVCAG